MLRDITLPETRTARSGLGWALSRLSVRKAIASILIANVTLLLSGCASSIRVYPDPDQSDRRLSRAIAGLHRGQSVKLVLSDGTEVRGIYRGLQAAPDSAILLRHSPWSARPGKPGTVCIGLSTIHTLDELRGPSTLTILGVTLFGVMVVVALTGIADVGELSR